MGRMVCRGLLIVIAVVVSCVPAAGQPAPGGPPASTGSPFAPVALPPDLDRVLRDYEAAWRAGNGAQLAALFTEDGFAIQNGSPAARGRAAIAAAIAGPGGPLQLQAYAFSASETVAYIVGGYRYENNPTSVGRFVLALRREGGRWLIAADLDNAPRR